MANILIIDDEPTILQLYKYIFEEGGHTVKTALNGKAALQILEEFTPDFMIVDVAMPEMSGWQFILELKKLAFTRPHLKCIPYIVMTGENFMTESKRFAFETDKNFKGYFMKMAPTEKIYEEAEKILKEKGKI